MSNQQQPPRIRIKDDATGATGYVPYGQIRQNPHVLHTELPSELVERVARFKEILGDLDPPSLERTLESFKRDRNPEREVEVWEWIAATFQETMAKFPHRDRRKVYKQIFRQSIEKFPFTVGRLE